MNYSFVLRQFGLLLLVISLAVLVVAGWSLIGHSEHDAAERAATYAHLLTVVGGASMGVLLWWWGKRGDDFLSSREALLLVALSWLGGAALAAMPFWLWTALKPQPPTPDIAHPYASFAASYFEAMSGLTTTGATVLSEIETLPRSLLLWRSLTHWMGGLGIVVLFVAVLPSLGVGGKKLFQVEATGPTTQSVRPRIKHQARALWFIYLGMTIALAVALRHCGMSWFDAINHTFATLATGGFSTQNASLGGYDHVGIDVIVIIFMVLAGVNFGLYYQLLHRRFKEVYRDPELRLYLAFIVIGSLLVCIGIYNRPIATTVPDPNAPGILTEHGTASLGQALQYGVFQVVSIQTTTGYCTSDFNQWGLIPKAVLLGLMFVGGSAGSTGGGIKVIRILIGFKVMIAEVERIFRPNIVRTIKVGRMTVDPELRTATMVYLLGIVVIFIIGTFLLMLLEQGGNIDIVTASTACAATLNNIGPGLAQVGAVENYGWFSTPSLYLMSVLMALGRLEVYAIFVLFVPRFWRGE